MEDPRSFWRIRRDRRGSRKEEKDLSCRTKFHLIMNEKECSIERWKDILWNACVYIVIVGMLIALLMGLNMSWSAISAALALIVLDFKDAKPCLEKVICL